MKNEAIEMIKSPLSVVRIAVFCLPLALVASCGSGSQAVEGTIIKFGPDAFTQLTHTSPGLPSTLDHLHTLVTISLLSQTGYPQIGTQLTVDTSGTLYIVDNSTNPVTYTAVATPYVTTTDSSGTLAVALDFSVPAGTTGAVTVLYAISGTAYGHLDNTYTVCTPTAPATSC
jgi:hypothetical protein